MYLSCDTKKFHDNESTHILHNFWTSTHRGEASPVPPWRRHWCDGSCCSPTHGSTQPTDNSAPNFVTAFTWTTMSAATTLCNLVFKSLADNMRQPTEARSTRKSIKAISHRLDSGAEGPRFKSQPRRCRVTVFGQTVYTHCASVHRAAKLVATLLRVAGVTAGLAESYGSLPPGL